MALCTRRAGAGRGPHHRRGRAGRHAPQPRRDRSLSRALSDGHRHDPRPRRRRRRLRQDDDPQRHERAVSARGAITTVIGPNGAGKSTMFKTDFRAAAGAQRQRDLRRPRHHQLRAAPACSTPASCYIPQGRNIFPGAVSVRHNLELGGVALADQSGCRRRLDAMMAALPDAARKGQRAGLDAVGRPAEAARSRARPAARSQADADRRAVDRPLADRWCRRCSRS